MKYFDKLSAAVQAAFSVRAVDTDKLLYCVKADMDGEGCYYDTYITFDNKTLYLLSGYDRLVKNKKMFDTQFDFKDFSEYPMEEIEKLYVDRYQFTARLMAKMTDGTENSLRCFREGFPKNSSSSAAVMKQSKRAKRPTIPHLTTRRCIVRSATENIPTRTEPSARTAPSVHGCSSDCSVCSVTTKSR